MNLFTELILNRYWLLVVISIIIAIIGFRLIFSSMEYRSPLRMVFGYGLAFIGVFLLILTPKINKILNEYDKHEQLEHVETYYLDGREVDPDTIDLDLYEFTIKDDVCYLTRK